MRHLKDAFLERKAALADRIGVAERDFITLGIATAAIIMFVGTGGTVVPKIMASLSGVGIGPDSALVNALLLNIALIIFGWRRYRQLSDEVAERRRAEENARKLAETDPLTALLNRRGFANALGRLVESARETGSPVAVMMIDLDNFKRINDLNGHSAGDHVLMECTRRIGDLMPRSAVLARIGGDEFAVALRFDQQRPESVEKFAADILEALARPIAVTDARVEVTASVGITRADLTDGPDGPDFMRDPARLLEMADIAMYHAKRQGRNGYFWFEQRMADEMRYRVELENGIRDGLDKGEFVPFYEQQIDLETGELTGFEMLARWNSPRFGIVKPDIFIPLAEEIGLIGDLSEQLVTQALEDARQWDPGLTLSVNISPVQLRDPWFSQRLIKLLLSANFPPQRLEIEITESCIHENLGLVKTLISSLRNQGIQISLDD
ncbi:MAG: diguanylate cyclase, partial [Sphingomonadaceae bacterium]